MIIATKRHNKRFAKLEGQKIVNAEPGTVVDKKFMREDCLEFFMLSHFPIQVFYPQKFLPNFRELQNSLNTRCCSMKSIFLRKL